MLDPHRSGFPADRVFSCGKGDSPQQLFCQANYAGHSIELQTGHPSLPVNPKSFTFLEITPTEVYKISVSTLKTNKAAGLDNMPAGLLKFCAAVRESQKVWHVSSTEVLNSASFLQLLRKPLSYRSLRKEVIQIQATTDPSRFSRLSARCLNRIVHGKLSSFLQTWLHDGQSGFNPLSAKLSFQVRYPGGQRLKVISFSWSGVKSPSKCFSNTEPSTIIASRDEKRCNASVQWTRSVHSSSLRLRLRWPTPEVSGWLLLFAVPALQPDWLTSNQAHPH